MESLPYDILNKELIYYMEPLDRGNLGVVNKYNNSNRKEWKKKFRISSPERMVYHRLKFKRHCSNMESFIPDKYKSKNNNQFSDLPMVKQIFREPYPNNKKELIHAYIARDYYYCRNKNYWELINDRLNKGNWFRNMARREIPNFEEKYEKIKRSKDLYKFYDLFTKNQLDLLGW